MWRLVKGTGTHRFESLRLRFVANRLTLQHQWSSLALVLLVQTLGPSHRLNQNNPLVPEIRFQLSVIHLARVQHFRVP